MDYPYPDSHTTALWSSMPELGTSTLEATMPWTPGDVLTIPLLSTLFHLLLLAERLDPAVADAHARTLRAMMQAAAYPFLNASNSADPGLGKTGTTGKTGTGTKTKTGRSSPIPVEGVLTEQRVPEIVNRVLRQTTMRVVPVEGKPAVRPSISISSCMLVLILTSINYYYYCYACLSLCLCLCLCINAHTDTNTTTSSDTPSTSAHTPSPSSA